MGESIDEEKLAIVANKLILINIEVWMMGTWGFIVPFCIFVYVRKFL